MIGNIGGTNLVMGFSAILNESTMNYLLVATDNEVGHSSFPFLTGFLLTTDNANTCN